MKLSRPLRHLLSATVLFGLVSSPFANSFGQAQSVARRLPAFELADRTFYNATLEVRGEDLMVRHSEGIYNHRLEDMYYKTLLRIGTVEPALRGSAEYQAALGRFVPKMEIGGRAITGVRLENLENDLATLLTDQGRASCRWSDLTMDRRTFFLAEKGRLDQLQAARLEHERRQQQAQAAAAQAQEAERQHILAARQMEIDRQHREAEKEQFAETAEGVLGAVVAAGAIYGLYQLLKEGSSNGPSQAETDRINDWANQRAAKEWEERLNRAP